MDGKTPLEFINALRATTRTLGANTKLPRLDEIPDGDIMLIRFIRSDRKLNIFGEKFIVAKDLVYSYVKAVIITSIHTLQVYLVDELVEVFGY